MCSDLWFDTCTCIWDVKSYSRKIQMGLVGADMSLWHTWSRRPCFEQSAVVLHGKNWHVKLMQRFEKWQQSAFVWQSTRLKSHWVEVETAALVWIWTHIATKSEQKSRRLFIPMSNVTGVSVTELNKNKNFFLLFLLNCAWIWIWIKILYALQSLHYLCIYSLIINM